MKFYSTNSRSTTVSLEDAVTQGLAPDNGLYMPESIPLLPNSFFETIQSKSFQEIAYEVALALLGDDIPAESLKRIISHTIQFDAPIVSIEPTIYALELFHGPTLAFKDFGARFMSQLLGHFAQKSKREIVILVATSGDTGSAVANGFLGVEGVKVFVLYPSGKVSEIQEKQFTTLENNITALEVKGTFDDCQKLVKEAFLDKELQERFFLTSANSINIARLIPQSFYYFYAYAQLQPLDRPLVFSVPSGNFGNLTGGLLAKRMGLPVSKFIASTNVNDIVPEYLLSGAFQPRASKETISNAMDVGNPSNFVRMLDLYDGNYENLRKDISGYSFSDEETEAVMREVHTKYSYVLDPHGAIGYLGLKEYLKENKESVGVFLETAHPGKFLSVVNEVLQKAVALPERLKSFMRLNKKSVKLENSYSALKDLLIKTLS